MLNLLRKVVTTTPFGNLCRMIKSRAKSRRNVLVISSMGNHARNVRAVVCSVLPPMRSPVQSNAAVRWRVHGQRRYFLRCAWHFFTQAFGAHKPEHPITHIQEKSWIYIWCNNGPLLKLLYTAAQISKGRGTRGKKNLSRPDAEKINWTPKCFKTIAKVVNISVAILADLKLLTKLLPVILKRYLLNAILLSF